ncbi:hypothetical protein A5625_10490 [Mycobacterium sp. 1465703.0]|nr:hypothetical protein A5625_10490 [Mycobacterium sp. 1465703.0]
MGMAPVLTQVTLHRVVDHDDIATAPILWHPDPDSRVRLRMLIVMARSRYRASTTLATAYRPHVQSGAGASWS